MSLNPKTEFAVRKGIELKFNKNSFLFVFGCQLLAIIEYPFIHECGHAFASLLTGGEISGFHINPISWSAVEYKIPPPNLLFTAWGGILFSTFAAILFVWAAFRFRNPYWTILGYIGMFIFYSNGSNYIFGVIYSTGDPSLLNSLGVENWVSVLVGCVSILCGGYLALLLQPFTGIETSDSFVNRLVVNGGGYFSFRLLVMIYNLVLVPNNTNTVVVNFIVNVFLILIFGMISRASRNLPYFKNVQILKIEKRLIFTGFLNWFRCK